MTKQRLFAAWCLLPFLASCDGGWHRGPAGVGGWGNMMPYGYGGGMFIGMLVFLVLIAALVYAVGRGMKSNSPGAPDERPLDILKRRYAKGEITKDEYDRMKKDLDS
mgnify:CR=1 FL=1